MERERFSHLILIFLFLALILGLINLQLFQGNKFKDLSNKNSIRLIPKDGCRGRILDSDGQVIVSSRLSYDVMGMPKDENDLQRAIARVATVLGLPAGDLREAYQKGYLTSAIPVAIVKDIGRHQAIVLSELMKETDSILIEATPKRFYPYGRLASHIIGYISAIDTWRLNKLTDYGYGVRDVVGFGGVEERYDYYLRPDKGGLSVQVDSRGRFVRILGSKAASGGRDIQLTLNLKVQKIVEEALGERNGSVVVMSPYGGEIIAMASRPNFSPQAFLDQSDSVSSFLNNKDAPLINRAISASYPAGSVFKPLVALAALETRKVNLSTTFLCSGSTWVGRQEFACWMKHGPQGLIAALAHSCNVFFYRTGLLLGPQIIHDYALKLGLSKTTSFELPYETAGFIPSPLWRRINKWFDGDTANLSIGQGEVQVSPLQIARMMSVFANGGYLVRPYLVKSVAGSDISGAQKKIINLHLKEANLNYLRQGLRQVVLSPSGTAHILSGLNISCAGKTGTAQAPPAQPHGWFAGYFPFKNPKFVICVFLEHGGPGYMASLTAKQIIEAMLKEGLI